MRTNIQNVTYTSAPKGQPSALTVQLLDTDFSTAICIDPHPLWFSYDVGGFVGTDQAAWYGRAVLVDLSSLMGSKNVETFQSVYIDNLVNPGLVLLINDATGQRIMCPPFSQGVYPVLAQPGNQAMQWRVVTADAIATPGFNEIATSFTANILSRIGVTPREALVTLIFTDVAAPIGTWTHQFHGCQAFDCTDTITLGGTFQQVGANAGGLYTGAFATSYRRGFLVQNPNSAIEPLYVDLHQNTAAGVLAATVANSIELMPGERYQERGNDAYMGSIHVMAATTGHAYMFKIFR